MHPKTARGVPYGNREFKSRDLRVQEEENAFRVRVIQKSKKVCGEEREWKALCEGFHLYGHMTWTQSRCGQKKRH
jgi:hypothetical protein